MLSFELSAIDIILSISVVVLFIMYMIKLPTKKYEEKSFRQPKVTAAAPKRPVATPQRDSAECPRGFGNIRMLGKDNSVSERCLGCYRIMECYSESE